MFRSGQIPYAATMDALYQLACDLVPKEHIARIHISAPLIHIIMERSTGKTKDAFVEVGNSEIALNAVRRNSRARPRPELDGRPVTLQASSQSELMHEMFPRTTGVVWDDVTGAPVRSLKEDKYSSGFRGFLTKEELNGMIRHAERPKQVCFDESFPSSERCRVLTRTS